MQLILDTCRAYLIHTLLEGNVANPYPTIKPTSLSIQFSSGRLAQSPGMLGFPIV